MALALGPGLRPRAAADPLVPAGLLRASRMTSGSLVASRRYTNKVCRQEDPHAAESASSDEESVDEGATVIEPPTTEDGISEEKPSDDNEA